MGPGVSPGPRGLFRNSTVKYLKVLGAGKAPLHLEEQLMSCLLVGAGKRPSEPEGRGPQVSVQVSSAALLPVSAAGP